MRPATAFFCMLLISVSNIALWKTLSIVELQHHLPFFWLAHIAIIKSNTVGSFKVVFIDPFEALK